MTNKQIAFVGGGNMARALITGLLSKTSCVIRAADPGAAARAATRELGEIEVFAGNAEAIADADCVVFAVKPQIMGKVCQEAAAAIRQYQPLIVSVAAGIECGQISNWLGGYERIVRVIPNTPALIGAGATGLYANSSVAADDRELAATLFASVGLCVWVSQERLIDVVTSLSGSGPAYFFYVLEALESAAISMGLPAADARKLARQTALGAARMALQEDGELAILRERVTSPGGTTEAALNTFAAHDMAAIIEAALQAAAARAAELARNHGEN